MPDARILPRRRRYFRRGFTRRTRRNVRRRRGLNGLAILAAVAVALIIIALMNSR
jgi:hypothetical protein